MAKLQVVPLLSLVPILLGPLAAQTPPPVAPAAAAQAEPKLELPALKPEVTRAEIEAHVRFLASDELKGRPTGSPEALLAARYLAEVLRASGVQPAGDDGTFLQRVPLERARMSKAPELLVTPVAGEAFQAEFQADFEWPAGLERTTAALRVVHVRNATEFPKTPDPAVALFMDMSNSDRRRLLVRKDQPGAQGWGLVISPGNDERAKPRSGRPTPWSNWQRQASLPRSDQPLRLHGPLLERLRKGELATLQLTTHVERQQGSAVNVVGILRARPDEARKQLATQAVVLSAHYDHLGEHAAEGGEEPAEPQPGQAGPDLIYNGADDDASGCAAVLELAGAFGQGAPPARPLVFLLATGEEIGLLGTNEYLDRPCVPLTETIANLNFEMIGRPDPMAGGAGKLWLTGYERTNLGEAFRAAGLPVVVDPRPEQNFYQRSDNYAFVLRGVIGQSFSTYNLHKDYHRVSDSADTLDYAHMEGCVRAALAAVQLVAGGTLEPQWKEGYAPKEARPR